MRCQISLLNAVDFSCIENSVEQYTGPLARCHMNL